MQVAILTGGARAGDALGNQVAEKLAFFLDRGAQVRVFAESRQGLHPFVQPYCHRLNPQEPSGAEWAFLAAADLIVVEYGQFYASLALLPLLTGAKPRLLFDYHGVTPAHLWEPQHREGLEAAAEHRGLVWCADLAVAHSRFTRRELLDHGRFPSERCASLPLPVDTDFFFPGPPERALSERLGLTDASLLLFVGRLAVNKRVATLVEALAHLREETPPVHAVVVGDAADIYQLEMRRCQARARELGVAHRLHFLGHVRPEDLRDAYRSADVFVMPSLHEGFCLPVLEAMACGVPVVAARAAALPETVGDAGLTFTADDPDDLARTIRRVLADDTVTRRQGDMVIQCPSPFHLRVAVVACRYGTDVVGGAETSLRLMAESLRRAGHHVEVFTTCTRSETDRVNEWPEGTQGVAGIPVHRFRLDGVEPLRAQEALRAIAGADGAVRPEVEAAYLQHSIRSSRLVQALTEQEGQFDAILTGPYLFGLPFEVAQALPRKTLLMPCFHDEPMARLRAWVRAYTGVGGLLFHSTEEQAFAESALGLNVPGGACVGTVIEVEVEGDGQRGRQRVAADVPYLVYCGRYGAEKGLVLLLEHFYRYSGAHPGRFMLAVMGEGDVVIPRAPWLRDLGFVDDQAKRDLLAGAAALALLSCRESLSLAALEAWAQGVPVLAHAGCAVMAGHLRRCGGGRAVDSYEAFAAALDDLWARPQHWQTLGQRGREYVRSRYGSREVYTAALEGAIRELQTPLAERMRRRGLERAAAHARPCWRERFGALVEELLDQPARSHREQIEVRPRTASVTAHAGDGGVLVPVRVSNQGTQPGLAQGPAALALRSEVVDGDGRPVPSTEAETTLPTLLLPGQTLAVALPVRVPATPGTYQVHIAAIRVGCHEHGDLAASEPGRLQLTVEAAPQANPEGCCAPLLAEVQKALVEAHRRQQLPDQYLDVTQGWFASWKAWIKRKLLGNFKHAYVDVLSHQQSAFNRQVLTALRELAECCAVLDSCRQIAAGRDAASMLPPVRALLDQVAEQRRLVHELQERIAHLEARALSEQVPSR